MSSETLSTTLRVLNHFWRPCATRPSISVLARRRRALDGCRPPLALVVLGIEDGFHPLLLAALHHGAVLRQEDRDRLAADHVVFLPHPRVAEQHDALLEIVVLGAASRAGAAVARDDADAPCGHR